MQRSKFTEFDDIEMIKWSVNNRWVDIDTPFGLVTWDRYMKQHNSHHSSQSLLGRFRRIIVPNLHMYASSLRSDVLAEVYNRFGCRLDADARSYLRQLIKREESSPPTKKRRVAIEEEEVEQNQESATILENHAKVEKEVEEEEEVHEIDESSTSKNNGNLDMEEAGIEDITPAHIEAAEDGEDNMEIDSHSDMNTTVPIDDLYENAFIEEPSSFSSLSSSHPPNAFWNNDMLPFIEYSSKEMYKSIYSVENEAEDDINDIKPADRDDLMKVFQIIFAPTPEPLRKIVILPLQQDRKYLKIRRSNYLKLEKSIKNSESSIHSQNAAILYFMYFEYQLARRILVKNETKYTESIDQLLIDAARICNF